MGRSTMIKSSHNLMLYLNSMFIPKKSAMAFYQNQLWKHWQVQACFILVKNPRTARLLKKFSFFIHCCRGNILAKGEREFPFPVIPKNGGLWFPFPNFGNGFCHSLPVPEFRECFFSFPSRSQILGMDFFHSLPVPELWEWKFFIPFPFPNWPFQSRESKGKMVDCERC